jgi:hypothetical protein
VATTVHPRPSSTTSPGAMRRQSSGPQQFRVFGSSMIQDASPCALAGGAKAAAAATLNMETTKAFIARLLVDARLQW